MGLVDYISRNPCQPAKIISKFYDYLVATLSNIKSDAKLQKERAISAICLNKFHLDKISVAKIHITQQPNREKKY